jgi:hypothetical protein
MNSSLINLNGEHTNHQTNQTHHTRTTDDEDDDEEIHDNPNDENILTL